MVADSWATSPDPDSEVVVASLELVQGQSDLVQPPIKFMAYVKDFGWNARDGELNIKLACPMAEKERAFAITNHPGMMLDITAALVVFEIEDEDDGD